MKTNLSRLATLVVALFVTSSVSTSWGQGITRFEIYTGIVDRQASSAAINNILTSIGAGTPQAGAWEYVPNGSTISLEKLFHRGAVGSGSRAGLVIDSLSPFTLSQLAATYEDPMFGQFSTSFSSYSNFGVGINRGPDNILGTADDITYTSGNANSPVHAIRILGIGNTIEIGTSSIADALNTWSSVTHQKVTYSLFGNTCESQIGFSVPEPSSIALVLLGLVSLHTLKKKK